MDQQAEKKRVTGLGRRTRQEIVKWNQTTAERFQIRGKTSDIPPLPFAGQREHSDVQDKNNPLCKQTTEMLTLPVSMGADVGRGKVLVFPAWLSSIW